MGTASERTTCHSVMKIRISLIMVSSGVWYIVKELNFQTAASSDEECFSSFTYMHISGNRY